MEASKTRYSHYNINYHLVWIPKYRRRILTGKVTEELAKLIRKICTDRGVKVLSLSIQPDHVHLFVSAPPRYSPATLINAIKGCTSYFLRRLFPELKRICDDHLWTGTYYAGTAGVVSSKTIRRYIEECQQETR